MIDRLHDVSWVIGFGWCSPDGLKYTSKTVFLYRNNFYSDLYCPYSTGWFPLLCTIVHISILRFQYNFDKCLLVLFLTDFRAFMITLTHRKLCSQELLSSNYRYSFQLLMKSRPFYYIFISVTSFHPIQTLEECVFKQCRRQVQEKLCLLILLNLMIIF